MSSHALWILAYPDRVGARTLAAGDEAREITAGVLLVVVGEQLVADRLEFADEQAERGAVLRDRPIAVDDDHLPVPAQRRTQPPEEGVGFADLVIHVYHENAVE